MLLSQHIELRHCLQLMGNPRFGYLLKDRVLHLEEFDEALRRVAAGGTALDPDVVQALVRSRDTTSGIDLLTEREREVLSLVAQGHSNAGVASALFLSDRTVEAHLRTVFTKLDLVDVGTTNRRVRRGDRLPGLTTRLTLAASLGDPGQLSGRSAGNR